MSEGNGYSSNSNTSSNSNASNDHQISMKIDRDNHPRHQQQHLSSKSNRKKGGLSSLSIPSFSLNRRIRSAPSFLSMNVMHSRTCPIKVVNFMLVFVLFIAIMISIQMVVFKHILNLRSDYVYESSMVGHSMGHGEGLDGDELKLCLPKTKIAFAKTHKTGSTTLQNIIFRFGFKYNLMFAMPAEGWEFSVLEPFKASHVQRKPWKGVEFDVFAFHSQWNFLEVKKLMPTATFISLLRDPVDCFESIFVYMELRKKYKMTINEFAKEIASTGAPRDQRRPDFGKNQQLFVFGMTNDTMEDREKVQETINELDMQLDFVMITEYFDESLVMLQNIMCWSMDDVVYLKKNFRMEKEKSNITEESREILTKWLWADFLLYDHFKKKFMERIIEFGEERLANKREKLNALNTRLRTDCVQLIAGKTNLTGEYRDNSPTVLGYKVDESKPMCILHGITETAFVEQLRKKQLAKLKVLDKRHIASNYDAEEF